MRFAEAFEDEDSFVFLVLRGRGLFHGAFREDVDEFFFFVAMTVVVAARAPGYGEAMTWLLVVISGLLEVGWAIGLKASQGMTRPVPTVLTIAGMLASFALLSIAVRQLPIGTAYAVWVGIGAVGTAALGIVIYAEPASAIRIACLAMIVVGIIGLKWTSAPAS